MTCLVPGRDRSVFYAPTVTATWAAIRCAWEPATCAGTRAVSGPCRTTAEEEPRVTAPAPGPVLTYADVTPMGGEVFFSESSTGSAAFSFRILAEDKPEDVERKAREAVENWKAGK